MNHMDIAMKFIGIEEVPGATANPMILAMLKLDGDWPQDDSVPWCAAFVNYIAWLCDLERSTSLRARSWLRVGVKVDLEAAVPGDVVILMRGKGDQPGPEVIEAPGHVGFYMDRTDTHIGLLGGNQSDTVKVSQYPVERLLGVRRIWA